MPELLRRLALAVRCGALAHAVRCLSSGSSREKMAFPPPRVAKLALLVRMNGAWDCFAQKIACSACPASAELLCIRCEVHGDIYFLSRNLLRFAPPVRRFSGVPASPRIPWSLPSLRQPCLQVPPRILEGTAKKRRLSKKFSACLIPGRVPPFFPLVAMVDLLMRMPQRILRSMASITP